MAPNHRRTVAKLLRAVGFALVLRFLSIRERALTAFFLFLSFSFLLPPFIRPLNKLIFYVYYIDGSDSRID